MSRTLGQGPTLQTVPETAAYLLRPNTMVALGDSLIEQAGGAPVSTDHRSYGMLTWAQFFMGHRLKLLRNSGIGGERSDQILSRVTSGVLAHSPGYCFVIAGTNDIAQAVPVATIKANLSAIWTMLDNAGIRVVASTIPPRNTYTGTMLADLHTLNVWIRSEGRRRRNLRVADIYSAVVNSGGTGYASGYSADGIHPGNKGAPYAGKAVADTFAQIIGPLVPAALDLASGEGDPINIQTQSRFTNGTIADNTPPTGWTQAALVGGPIGYSKVARTDGLTGSWLRVTVPIGSSLVLRNNNSLLSMGRFAIGDTVQAAMEVHRTLIDQAPAAGVSGLSMSLIALGPSLTYADCAWNLGNDNQAPFDQYGVMQTEQMVTPAGTTQFQLQFTISGGQTIDFDRATIRNITRNGG